MHTEIQSNEPSVISTCQEYMTRRINVMSQYVPLRISLPQIFELQIGHTHEYQTSVQSDPRLQPTKVGLETNPKSHIYERTNSFGSCIVTLVWCAATSWRWRVDELASQGSRACCQKFKSERYAWVRIDDTLPMYLHSSSIRPSLTGAAPYIIEDVYQFRPNYPSPEIREMYRKKQPNVDAKSHQ